MRPHGSGPLLGRCALGLLGAVALQFLAGCARQEDSPADRTPLVRVVQPVEREVTEYCYFTGRTESKETIDLQARVTGYLSAVEFTPGDVVPAGKELFKIDPRPYEAAYNIALAQIELAKARLKLAEADFRRAQELGRTPGVISQAEFDKFEAAQTEAGAQVAAAEANANAAKLNVDFTSIAAPIEGMISRNYQNVGDLILQDNTLLSTLVSMDPLFAYFEVDEATMLRVGRLINDGKIISKANGRDIPVQMALADEKESYPHVGMMDFIDNRISASTGTREIRAVFENPMLSDGKTRMFTPGMFVRVRVPLVTENEILIPQAAIGIDQGRAYVLLVDADDIVQKRLLETGPIEPDGLQVVRPLTGVSGAEAGGLSTDDRVIVGGMQLIRPGTKVRVRE